jgi:Zn-dependent protease with chaperone function
MQITGKYYPEGSTQYYSVTVNLYDSGEITVLVDETGLQLSRQRNEVRIKDKLGSIPREITFPENGLLSLVSTPDIDAWLAQASRNNAIFKMESSRKAVLLSLVLVPLFLYSFFKYIIPGFAVHFAEYVPNSAVSLASKHTLYLLDKTILARSALPTEQQANFQEQWTDTLTLLNLNNSAYPLLFRQSDELGANAFALPDGTVVVTDDLVGVIDNNWRLLQAILLHELGHVEKKHSMRLISETLATSLAVNYFFGDVGGAIEVFAGLSNTVVQNQFSQKLEWEADNFALHLMSQHGLDTESFATAMEKLSNTRANSSKLENFFETHPGMKERIDNARKLSSKTK